jgi:chromosome segregation ATPase
MDTNTAKEKLDVKLNRKKAQLTEDKENEALKAEVRALQQNYDQLSDQARLITIDLKRAKTEAEKVPKPKTQEELLNIIEKMMALDEAFIEYKGILARASSTFAQLPAAHATLAKAAQNQQQGLGAINAFLGEGLRFQKNFSRNRLANKIKVAQAEADALAARADELDARVTSEELRKNLLKISLDRKKADSAADPDNESLKKEVAELQDRYNELDDRIRRLKLLQQRTRSRADEAQTAVTEMSKGLPGGGGSGT